MLKTSIVKDYTVHQYVTANIYIIDDIVDHAFCNSAIQLIEKLPLVKMVHEPYQNVECYINNTTELMGYDDSMYYQFGTDKCDLDLRITNNLNGITVEQIKNFVGTMNDKMKIVRDIMENVNDKVSFTYNSGYNLRKIYGRTKRHIDAILKVERSDVNDIDNEEIGSQLSQKYEMVRNSSMILSLNDDHVGGEFKFPHQNINLKLKRASLIIFPPYWTHPHEVSAVEDNTFRYTVHTWSHEKLKKKM